MMLLSARSALPRWISIATKADEKLYVQVTESMESETVRARELAPLQKIADNYEKNRTFTQSWSGFVLQKELSR